MITILLQTFAACVSLGAQTLRAEELDAFAARWAAVADRYNDTAERQNIAGSSLYFLHEGEIVAAEHFGMADIANGRAVDADTIYHWASVTKTFTAVAAMQLVERG
ncbi:MAG: serine hydrolase domain-containing protein, partial [Amphiplicatus sp.]